MNTTLDHLNEYYRCTCASPNLALDAIDHDYACDLWDCDEFMQGEVDWDNKLGRFKLNPEVLADVDASLDDLYEYDTWLESKAPATSGAITAISSKWVHKSCDHSQQEVVYPNGAKVYAHSVRGARHFVPDYALWLDSSQAHGAKCVGYMLPWTDYGLPCVPDEVTDALFKQVFDLASDGFTVETGCYGAHGRTGVVLACWAILAGVDKADACQWVWTNYCNDAIETKEQEWFVMRFGCVLDGTPVPDKPKPPPPPPKPVFAKTVVTKPANKVGVPQSNNNKRSRRAARKGRK